MDIHSLSHGKYRCKYHVVFAPKYRRLAIYGKYKAEIGKILRTICERKGVTIIEAELCPDHIHMLLEIPPKPLVQLVVMIAKELCEIVDKQINGNKKQCLRI